MREVLVNQPTAFEAVDVWLFSNRETVLSREPFTCSQVDLLLCNVDLDGGEPELAQRSIGIVVGSYLSVWRPVPTTTNGFRVLA